MYTLTSYTEEIVDNECNDNNLLVSILMSLGLTKELATKKIEIENITTIKELFSYYSILQSAQVIKVYTDKYKTDVLGHYLKAYLKDESASNTKLLYEPVYSLEDYGTGVITKLDEKDVLSNLTVLLSVHFKLISSSYMTSLEYNSISRDKIKNTNLVTYLYLKYNKISDYRKLRNILAFLELLNYPKIGSNSSPNSRITSFNIDDKYAVSVLVNHKDKRISLHRDNLGSFEDSRTYYAKVREYTCDSNFDLADSSSKGFSVVSAKIKRLTQS